MKCEVCLNLLDEYLDGELAGAAAEQVSAHLITCVGCASEFEGLAGEQELYARYDRALEIAPSMWPAIAVRTTTTDRVVNAVSSVSRRDRITSFFALPSLKWSFAGAVAVLLVAAVVGVAYLRLHRPASIPGIAVNKDTRLMVPESIKTASPKPEDIATVNANPPKFTGPAKASRKSQASGFTGPRGSSSDVVFSDGAYSIIEEQETQRHIEQAQNLLRSVRNIEFSDDDTEVDVSYEKALSRRLLDENVVLRRDAEMSGRFPVKTLLSSLEPFLLDIANLPDKTSPDDLRVIKDRVQQTEIVAALHTY